MEFVHLQCRVKRSDWEYHTVGDRGNEGKFKKMKYQCFSNNHRSHHALFTLPSKKNSPVYAHLTQLDKSMRTRLVIGCMDPGSNHRRGCAAFSSVSSILSEKADRVWLTIEVCLSPGCISTTLGRMLRIMQLQAEARSFLFFMLIFLWQPPGHESSEYDAFFFLNCSLWQDKKKPEPSQFYCIKLSFISMRKSKALNKRGFLYAIGGNNDEKKNMLVFSFVFFSPLYLLSLFLFLILHSLFSYSPSYILFMYWACNYFFKSC